MTSSVETFLRSNSNDHTLNHATILFKARHLLNQLPVLSHPYVPCAQHTKSSNSLTLYLYICNNALFWLFPSTLYCLTPNKIPLSSFSLPWLFKTSLSSPNVIFYKGSLNFALNQCCLVANCASLDTATEMNHQILMYQLCF